MLLAAAGRRAAAFWAAAALISFPFAVRAQEVEPLGDPGPPLDPSAPLDPLPGLGVDWPDMAGSEQGISETPDTSIADAASERAYTVDIEGLAESDAASLLAEFHMLSTLEEGRKERANSAQLDRRARQDADLLTELLRAHGYYDALVETRVEAGAGANSIRVVLHVEPGPRYSFADVRLPGIEAAGADADPLRQAFAVKDGDPVDAAKVAAAQAALQVELGQRGYAFADVGALDISVDHDSRTATLVLPVDPKGSRKFGAIVVEGTPLFSAKHLQEIARFKPGQPYRAARLEDLRRALIQTALVSSVVIRPVSNSATGAVDIFVALEPAPLRTIAGAAGYGTGEGFRLEASWQHRNLLPPEGAVTFRGIAGTQEQLVGATLRRSNFRQRDQVLTANIVASHIDRQAYTARSLLVGAGLERETNIFWQKLWTWSVGADLIATDETDVDGDSGMIRRRTFIIAALPGTLSYDGSNDLLDPTRGFRLSGRLSPEVSFQNSAFVYARAQVDGTFYQPIGDRLTLAGRARLGSIFGASLDRIAPSRRFYAGGGGSVRGYGYQDLGPRDPVFDDPIGGRSLAEFAIEARYRIGNFGIVPFLDAGNIYTSTLPHVGNLRFGTGIGVRYHTRFGPIRIDVGTPLDRQPGDARVAVYVSLGQAF